MLFCIVFKGRPGSDSPRLRRLPAATSLEGRCEPRLFYEEKEGHRRLRGAERALRAEVPRLPCPLLRRDPPALRPAAAAPGVTLMATRGWLCEATCSSWRRARTILAALAASCGRALKGAQRDPRASAPFSLVWFTSDLMVLRVFK